MISHRIWCFYYHKSFSTIDIDLLYSSLTNAKHRTQLRRILGHSYPNIISNEDLYQKAKTIPISKTAKKARWRMLGHVLRLDKKTSAAIAMEEYAIQDRSSKKNTGRQRSTLPYQIQNDISSKELPNIQEEAMVDHNYATTLPPNYKFLQFKCRNDIHYIRSIASNRKRWQKLSSD